MNWPQALHVFMDTTDMGAVMAELSPTMEDYLKEVYLTVCDKGGVKPGDLSIRLNVSASSVTGALHLLADEGLIEYVPYGSISLTDAGMRLARELYYRHSMVTRFLVDVLGVEIETARESACRLEHTISPDILRRFVEYMHFLQHQEGNPMACVSAFKAYYMKKVNATGERQ